jgi:hypothetical protein
MSRRHVNAEMEARKKHGETGAMLLPGAGIVPTLISAYYLYLYEKIPSLFRYQFRRQNPVHNHQIILNMKDIVPFSVMGQHPASFWMDTPQHDRTTRLI